jgi:hypothetical protein
MPAAFVGSSLQLSISAQTIHTANHFKLPSEYQKWISAPLFHLSMARCQSGPLLREGGYGEGEKEEGRGEEEVSDRDVKGDKGGKGG